MADSYPAPIKLGKEVQLRPHNMFILYAVFSFLSILITTPERDWLNWYLSIVWSLNFVVAGIGFIQATGTPQIKMSTYSGMVNKRVIFLIPSVCRNDTLPALTRVISSVIKHVPSNFSDFRIDIVVEEHSEAKAFIKKRYKFTPHVRILEVPAKYKTQNNTRHKARANQYATEIRMNEGDNNSDTYVYHLDDDTHIAEDTVASIAEFIDKNHNKLYLAQGILTFPHELSPSWMCRMADSIRPADDVMRFRFFTGSMGTPLGGLHGEHLLIRADVEENIGWDFGDVLVEDAYFALAFSEKHPKKAGVLNSYSYGASPGNLWDLIKQRRRWNYGLQKLILDKRFFLRTRAPLLYFVSLWTFGLFQFVGLALLAAYITGFNNTSPVITGVLFIWCFNLAYFMWQYIEGLKINMNVSKKRYSKLSRITHLILMPFLLFWFTLVEGFASFLGILQWFKREIKFQVIQKGF